MKFYIPIFSKTWNFKDKLFGLSKLFSHKKQTEILIPDQKFLTFIPIKQKVNNMSDILIRKDTKFFVIHCSATRPINHVTVDMLRQWHLQRGFSDIGYHYYITTDGTIHKGREPDDCVGAGVKGHNDNTLHICLEGGLNNNSGAPSNTYTSQQFLSLNNLIHLLVKKYPHAEVLGHRDLSPDSNHDGIIETNEFLKACPCFNAISWAQANNLPYAKLTKETQ